MQNINGTTCQIEDLGDARPQVGCVDEVIIWNRSLSQAEIQNHYYRGAANLTFQTRTGSYYENVKYSADLKPKERLLVSERYKYIILEKPKEMFGKKITNLLKEGLEGVEWEDIEKEREDREF